MPNRPHFREKRPVTVEHLDVVAVLVGDVDVLAAVEGNSRHPVELAVLGAKRSKITQELLVVDPDDADPNTTTVALASGSSG